MVIVAGHVIVGREDRDGYLAGCAQVVKQARNAPGCLDFTISADLLDPTRINVFERWESQSAVEAFRGSGPSDEQAGVIVSASVAEYDVLGDGAAPPFFHFFSRLWTLGHPGGCRKFLDTRPAKASYTC